MKRIEGLDKIDGTLLRLAIIAALPFLACVVIILHDPGVSLKLLWSGLVVLVICVVVAGGLSYVLAMREHRADEPR